MSATKKYFRRIQKVLKYKWKHIFDQIQVYAGHKHIIDGESGSHDND